MANTKSGFDTTTSAFIYAQVVLLILKTCIDAPWNRVQNWSMWQVLAPTFALMGAGVGMLLFLGLVLGAKALHERATRVD